MFRDWFIILLLWTLAALFLLAGCGKPEAETGNPPNGHPENETEHDERRAEGAPRHAFVELSPEALARAGIRTAPVEQDVLLDELSTTGQVDFDQARLAHVSPRIPGRVHAVQALLGRRVQAGEVLAEIDSIELGKTKAELLQAKSRKELAQRSYEREEKLFGERITSEQDVLSAEAELREATTALGTAEETLHLYGLDQAAVEALDYDAPKSSIYSLRAPFPGTIVERHATLGELVTPERNLFTLADLGRVWIWIDVHQHDLGRVHLGDEARARVDSFPGEVFSGTVSYLSAQVEAATRTVRARIDVPNPGERLRPGMFVEVELLDPHGDLGQEERGRCLVVAESAVARDGGELAVYVVHSAGRFERRVVETGRRAGGRVEVLSGVEPGEEVVVVGTFLIKSAAASESLGGGHGH